MFDLFPHNPLVVLYLIQAVTYGIAATVSRRGNHRALCICYLTSALLHCLLGACHLMHFGWYPHGGCAADLPARVLFGRPRTIC